MKSLISLVHLLGFSNSPPFGLPNFSRVLKTRDPRAKLKTTVYYTVEADRGATYIPQILGFIMQSCSEPYDEGCKVNVRHLMKINCIYTFYYTVLKLLSDFDSIIASW